jgi:hypothetical protein
MPSLKLGRRAALQRVRDPGSCFLFLFFKPGALNHLARDLGSSQAAGVLGGTLEPS